MLQNFDNLGIYVHMYVCVVVVDFCILKKNNIIEDKFLNFHLDNLFSLEIFSII